MAPCGMLWYEYMVILCSRGRWWWHETGICARFIVIASGNDILEAISKDVSWPHTQGLAHRPLGDPGAVTINVSGSNTFQLNKCFTFPEKVLLGDTPMYIFRRRRKSTSHYLNSMLTDIHDAIWPQWCLSSICWVSLINSKLYNTNMCFLFVLGDGGRYPKCRVQSMATMWGNDLINTFSHYNDPHVHHWRSNNAVYIVAIQA